MTTEIINIIVTIVTLTAVIIVGFILKEQIKLQNEKIKNIETINKVLKEYTDIFSMDTLKKYVDNERIVMKQDFEIFKRNFIKETVEIVSKEFVKDAESKIDKDFSKTLNDLVHFAYWFFKTYMNQDGKMYDHIKTMFPNSHDLIIGYIKEYSDFVEKSKTA